MMTMTIYDYNHDDKDDDDDDEIDDNDDDDDDGGTTCNQAGGCEQNKSRDFPRELLLTN